MNSSKVFFTTVLTAGLSSILYGAPLAITEITTSPASSPGTPVDVDTELLSITTSEGTFANLVGGTASGVTNPANAPYFWQVTNPGSNSAALSGLRITDSVANVQAGFVTFGAGVTSSNTFFLMEIGGDDSVELAAIDSTNADIGSFNLPIQTSHYGPSLFQSDTPNQIHRR